MKYQESSVELVRRFSVRGSYKVHGQIAHAYARQKRATDFMRDRHGEAGHDANKTKLIHVACAIETSHRAVRVGIIGLSDTVSRNASRRSSCRVVLPSPNPISPKSEFIHLVVMCIRRNAGPFSHALLRTRGLSRCLRTRSKASINRCRLGFELGRWRSLAWLRRPGRLDY